MPDIVLPDGVLWVCHRLQSIGDGFDFQGTGSRCFEVGRQVDGPTQKWFLGTVDRALPWMRTLEFRLQFRHGSGHQLRRRGEHWVFSPGALGYQFAYLMALGEEGGIIEVEVAPTELGLPFDAS